MNFMSGRSGFYEDVTVTGGGSPFNVYGSAASGAAPVSSPTANGSGGDEDSDDHMLGGGRGSGEGSSSASGASYALIEKEHMFDKVVTPSDVGKLNRLVIPKQHAEKYFPLDSSANEKGLLLNFEDRNGKPWRFRYSYWNSSQSYVMTKGWSRFVKDKKLDAGDVVSFQRGLGELGKGRLYIDWRRRPDVAELRPPQSIPALSLLPHQFPFHRSLHPWNQPLFLHPPNSPHYRHNQFQNHYPTPTSYGGGAPHYPYNAAYLQGNPYPPSGSFVYSRSGFPIPQEATEGGIRQAEEVVFESVPVVQGKASAKRLRLFGVNMDCPVGGESDALYDDPSMPLIQHMDSSPSINSSVDPPDCLQLMPYNENDDKGKGSVSLDLDM